ncbi:thiamine phosphate synthase [Gulbenkiania mobilis]|uniref:Thiamine-phosphate synthase n=1 Tax=Gulbenkiania mobilis TaxID=397457 RepID=A0ABY2CZW7_GULMO|nr:thiamine-phosphate pyrophosphorylase [Gulbenkiania mobilis]
MNRPPCGLYAITPETSDTEHLLQQTQAVLAGGACVLQYRSKLADGLLRRTQAEVLQTLCRRHGVLFIVNDDLGLAEAVGADGVHVGRDDAAVTEARQRLGRAAVVGASCYDSLERAREAVRAGADYVAFGAVHPSTTKPGAPRAPLALFAAARELGVPRVAIGGIRPDNAAAVVAAGADLLAVVDGVFGAADPRAAAALLAGLYPCA